MVSSPPAASTRLRTSKRLRCEPSGRTISMDLTRPSALKFRATAVALRRTSIPVLYASDFRWITCDFGWLVARSNVLKAERVIVGRNAGDW